MISSPAVHMERANIKPFVFVFKSIVVCVFVFAHAIPGQLVDDTDTCILSANQFVFVDLL